MRVAVIVGTSTAVLAVGAGGIALASGSGKDSKIVCTVTGPMGPPPSTLPKPTHG